MERWVLGSLPSSTEKRTPREPGPEAPRVPRRDGQIPRVLFSSPECRAVVVELEPDQAMGDHRVRERAIVHVVAGRVAIDVPGDRVPGDRVECGAGTLVTFAPGEQHGVRALEHSLLLLILAPWPAAEHYTAEEASLAQRLPANASVERASTTDAGS